jgi:hypothetical protein
LLAVEAIVLLVSRFCLSSQPGASDEFQRCGLWENVCLARLEVLVASRSSTEWASVVGIKLERERGLVTAVYMDEWGLQMKVSIGMSGDMPRWDFLPGESGKIRKRREECFV